MNPASISDVPEPELYSGRPDLVLANLHAQKGKNVSESANLGKGLVLMLNPEISGMTNLFNTDTTSVVILDFFYHGP
jgi:hypothetical protein